MRCNTGMIGRGLPTHCMPPPPGGERGKSPPAAIERNRPGNGISGQRCQRAAKKKAASLAACAAMRKNGGSQWHPEKMIFFTTGRAAPGRNNIYPDCHRDTFTRWNTPSFHGVFSRRTYALTAGVCLATLWPRHSQHQPPSHTSNLFSGDPSAHPRRNSTARQGPSLHAHFRN